MRIRMTICVLFLVLLVAPSMSMADSAGDQALLSVVRAVSRLTDFEVGLEAGADASATGKAPRLVGGRLQFHRKGSDVDLAVSGRLESKQGTLGLSVSKLGEKLFLSMEPPKGTQAQPMAFFVDLKQMQGGQAQAKKTLSPKELEDRTQAWISRKEAQITLSGNRIVIRGLDRVAGGPAQKPDRVEVVFDGRSHLPLALTAFKGEAKQGSLQFSGWNTRGPVRITPALATASYRPFDMRMLGGMLAPLAGVMGSGPSGPGAANPFAGLGGVPSGAGAPAGNPFEALMKARQQQGGAAGLPAGNPFEALMKARQQQGGATPPNPFGALFGKPGASGAGANPFQALMEKARQQQGKSGQVAPNPLSGLFGGPGAAGEAMKDPKFQKGMKQFQEGLLQMQKRLMEMKANPEPASATGSN